MKPLGRKQIQESERKLKAKRGAVRSKVKTANKPGLPLFRVFLFATFLGVSSYFASRLEWVAKIEKVKQFVSQPVSQVVVQGDFRFLERETLNLLIEDQKKGSFVRARLKDIKSQVEDVPWVESVSINRVWPDTLVIKVSEQKPIARWGESGFINQYGEIVKAEQTAELQKLPVLFGNENQSQEITRTYIDVAELLAARGIRLRGLQLDQKLSWTLTFNNNIEIVMGREEVIKKLRNFIYVYDKKLKQYESEIARIDLRYESGLAVRWKKEEEKLANSDLNKLLVKVN